MAKKKRRKIRREEYLIIERRENEWLCRSNMSEILFTVTYPPGKTQGAVESDGSLTSYLVLGFFMRDETGVPIQPRALSIHTDDDFEYISSDDDEDE